MPRSARISRDELSLRMRQVFRSNGFDGASMEMLAHATGLAKAALYHFFPGGKKETAAAALDNLKQWVTHHVLQPLEGSGTACERLGRMAEGLEQLYEGGRQPCLLGLFSNGESLLLFKPRLQTSFGVLMQAVATVLTEVGLSQAEADLRAEDLIIRIQGALVLSRVYGDVGPFSRLRQRMVHDLLKGTGLDIPSCEPHKGRAIKKARKLT